MVVVVVVGVHVAVVTAVGLVGAEAALAGLFVLRLGACWSLVGW